MKINLFKWLGAGVLTLVIAGCNSTSTDKSLTVGKLTESELFTTHTGFSHSFEQMQPSIQEIETVRSWPDNLRIDVYFGTWCHDSQREVPKLLKLLTYNPKININLVALDYQKTDPNGEAKTRGVKYTPTIIVMKASQELGRIVERPKQSLVLDIDSMI